MGPVRTEWITCKIRPNKWRSYLKSLSLVTYCPRRGGAKIGPLSDVSTGAPSRSRRCGSKAGDAEGDAGRACLAADTAAIAFSRPQPKDASNPGDPRSSALFSRNAANSALVNAGLIARLNAA